MVYLSPRKKYGGDEDDIADASNVGAIFNMLKAIMGAGGFALPWAFARMGVFCSLATVGACALFGSATVGELAKLKAHVENKTGRRGITYVDVAREALGAKGATLVYVLSVVCSFGVTSAYLVFVATTLQSLLPGWAVKHLILATALLVLPITWLDDFSILSRLSQSGTIAVVIGYVVTAAFAVSTVLHSERPHDPAVESLTFWHLGASMAAAVKDGLAHLAIATRAAFQSRASLTSTLAVQASGFGPIAFLFCVHFLLFPVMTASRASTRPGGFERLAFIAFTSAAAVNLIFGMICLRTFGNNVSSIVLNDIAKGTWYLTATKLLLCADLICSYPLVFAGGREIVERSLFSTSIGFQKDKHEHDGGLTLPPMFSFDLSSGSDVWLPATAKRLIVRTALVGVTVAIAQLQDFGMIISLVGGFAQVSLAFVLPPLMSLRLLERSMGSSRRRLNMALLPCGILIAVAATGAAVASAFEDAGG